MSHPTKDGAWVTATKVAKIECSKCGLVTISRHPVNDYELDQLIRDHVSFHGGRSY